MTFDFDISPRLRIALSKLAKKDRNLAITVDKKITQIINLDKSSINKHFKNLRENMSHLKRVHIGSFVLTFQIKGNIIIFEDFDHHNRIYKKRF